MLKIGEITSLRIGVPPPDVRVIRFEQTKRALLEKLEKTRAQNYSQGVRRQICTDSTKS